MAKFFTGLQADPAEISEHEVGAHETHHRAYPSNATDVSSGLTRPVPRGVAAPPDRWDPSLERKEACWTSAPDDPPQGPGPGKPPSGTGERRSPRILLRVPIRVTGNDASGVTFTEDTNTINISPYGTRISLIHSLLPDDVVLVKNLENDIEEEFRVVGGFQQGIGGQREWGLEAVNPTTEIWGALFAAVAEGTEPQALIECAACKTKAYSSVTSIEYDVLLSIGMISRHCDRCGETTRWKPSLPLAPAEGGTGAGDQPTQAEIEQRRERRLRLTLRLRVRSAAGATEIVQTRDVSKAGLCFESRQPYQVGEVIYITYLPSHGHAPYETKGKIAWSAGDSGNRCYGVSFLR